MHTMPKAIARTLGVCLLASLLVAAPAAALPADDAAPAGAWAQGVDRLWSWISGVADGLVSVDTAASETAPAPLPGEPLAQTDGDDPDAPPGGESYPDLDPNG